MREAAPLPAPSSGAGQGAPLAPDTQLGAFRVKRFLGEGAMGEVYLAQDVTLGRRVALKLIKERLMQRAGLERFLREAQTTAQFSHPHIVTVFAFGEHEGRPYLALEFVDGESLRARLAAGPLPEREAMRVVRAIADAIAEAHRHGVVHADLKPENVMIPSDGRVRVVDFGLARLLGSPSDGSVGTQAYMAPELWRGEAPTAAIDVWALGVLLFELIDGRRPFGQAELARWVFGKGPFELPASRRGAGWESIVLACLARDPAARPSAEEVSRRLQSLLESADPPAAEDRSPFPGLAAFTRDRAADYFGRQAELDVVVEHLRTRTLVPIAGPSGIGKSSFVEAALIPRLEDAGPWTILRCRPGAAPFESLSAALPAEDGAGLAAALRAHPESLALHLERLAVARGARVLLVVDQFEETFTLGPAAEAMPFCACVAGSGDPSDPWRVVLTIRDDFLGRLAESSAMRAHLGAAVALAPMSRADLEEAVRGPLARIGFTTDEPDLPARIAADVATQPAELPTLQFTCQALWERRDTATRRLLALEYAAMGGAGGALARHAERLLGSLTQEEVGLARAVLLRLVNPNGTRHPRPRRQALEGLARSASGVVDKLLQRRLLVARGEAESDDSILELAHEALSTAWPQLSRWLDETHEERLLVAELEQASTLWSRRGERRDETWTGDALAQAVRRVGQWSVQLPAGARAFLEAGVEREKRERRRRRLLLGSGVGGLALLALASAVAAAAFSEKEKEAIRQQEQIRLAAADMGVFDLHLEPFDWDARTQTASLPASPPELAWQLHAVDAQDSHSPGRLYAESDVRRGPHVAAAGPSRERVEARSGPAFLEVSRGPGCAPSFVYLQRLPGYTDRASHAEPPVLHILVPTCQASAEGMITIPEGEFIRNVDGAPGGPVTRDERATAPGYAIDRTEVTRAAFGRYGSMEPWSGDAAAPAPHLDWSRPGGERLPVVGISFFTARNYCRFMGKELPSIDQWQKAFRGGLGVGGAPNPAPDRQTTWLRPTSAQPANLADADGFDDLAPVGSFPDDVSPYGVTDLAGNASEWTATVATVAELRGLRVVAGGNWDVPAALGHHLITWRNTRPDRFLDFAIGFRCVASPPRP